MRYVGPGHNLTEGYGRGMVSLHDIDLDSADKAEEISERLAATFRSSDYSPPVLPAAAVEVHRLSQSKDVKMDDVLAVLEKDPLLAARVIKVASSPLYSGQPVQSLQQAIVRMGLRNLGEVVWEVAMHMRVFKSKVYAEPMEAVRKHSVAIAHISRAIAKLTPVPLEYGFLCGLLHDVGAAAALLLLGEGGSNSGKALSQEMLQLVLKQAHAEGSAVVAKCWQMSDDVQLVLGHHHKVTISGYAHPTAAIIAVAEKMVTEESQDKSAWLCWDDTQEIAFMAARDALGLTARTQDAIRKDTCSILEKLEQAQ